MNVPPPLIQPIPPLAPPSSPRPVRQLPPRVPPDGLAIASLICGLLSLLLFCSPLLSCMAGIPGLICGFTSRTRGGIRTGGIACCAIGMTASLVWIVIAVALTLAVGASKN